MRPMISTRFKFPWTLFRDALGGKSVVDTRYMNLKSVADAEDTIKYYGYDWNSQSDRLLLADYFQKALQFIQSTFIDPYPEDLKIPREILETQDLRHVLYWTHARSKNRELHQWACAAMKVVHTILHLENDFLFDYFPEARKQVFQRFHGHVYIDENNKIYLGKDRESFIPLYFFEVKREKDWSSKLIKLLHKPENTATRIFDHIGVRIVTESVVDLLLAFNYLLTSKIFIFANITPSRSRNSLLNVHAAQKSVNQILRKYKNGVYDQEGLLNALDEIPRDDLLLKHARSKDNPFSRQGYRSIQFTCRHLVRFPNPTYLQLMDLRQHMFVERVPVHTIEELDVIMAAIKREIRFFFPFEIQLMDRESFIQNQEGFGSHAEYKKSQLNAARKRVLGKILDQSRYGYESSLET